MKAYTDILQSRKLAEILSHNTADNTYERVVIAGCNLDIPEERQYVHRDIPFMFFSGVGVPCWSLAALLDVLPTTIGNFFEKTALRLRMDKGENDFSIWYENFDCGDVAEGLDVIGDNSIDACYEMILRLHEQKLI